MDHENYTNYQSHLNVFSSFQNIRNRFSQCTHFTIAVLPMLHCTVFHAKYQMQTVLICRKCDKYFQNRLIYIAKLHNHLDCNSFLKLMHINSMQMQITVFWYGFVEKTKSYSVEKNLKIYFFTFFIFLLCENHIVNNSLCSQMEFLYKHQA